MVQDVEKEKVEIYEIKDKKYRVVTRSIKNIQDIDKLYEVLCKFAISKLH